MKINKNISNSYLSNTLIKALLIIPAFSLMIFFPKIISAETYLIFTENQSSLGAFVKVDDTSDLENEFTGLATSFFNDNKEILPTGMAAANSLGYPNGISLLEKFPHFECGASAGGGIYKLNRMNEFDRNHIEQNPSIPGGGLNGGFFFGTGITERIDILAKFFSLRWFTSKSYKFDSKEENIAIEMDDYDIYSFGIKPRYNILKRSAPSLFSFGGVTVNLSLDYMKYMFKSDMKYNKSSGQDFKVQDPFDSNNTGTQEVILEGMLDGSLTMNSNFFSVTPEIFVFFDMFYFLNLYTGPSLSFTSGYMELNVDCKGKLRNQTAITVNSYTDNLELVPADSDVATARLVSKNKMHPMWIIPRWTVGFEISIWTVNLNIEASSILTSITDSATAQVGMSLRI